jgi:hypothetical protein
MSRRPTKETSDVSFRFRLTATELAEARGLADYLELELSELLRQLLREKRRQLVADGKRPPLKPREP